MRVFLTTLLFGAIYLLSGAAPAGAQTLSARAGVGAAIPVGGAGERRDPGPAAVLTVNWRLSRRWSLRLNGEWSLLHGPPAPAGQEAYDRYRDLRTYGASMNSVARLSDDGLAPYLLVGVGAYRLQTVGGHPSPYGTTGALQAGFGIEDILEGRFDPFIEMRTLIHITDYGSEEWSPTVYLPVLIGLRIR